MCVCVCTVNINKATITDIYRENYFITVRIEGDFIDKIPRVCKINKIVGVVQSMSYIEDAMLCCIIGNDVVSSLCMYADRQYLYKTEARPYFKIIYAPWYRAYINFIHNFLNATPNLLLFFVRGHAGEHADHIMNNRVRYTIAMATRTTLPVLLVTARSDLIFDRWETQLDYCYSY